MLLQTLCLPSVTKKLLISSENPTGSDFNTIPRLTFPNVFSAEGDKARFGSCMFSQAWYCHVHMFLLLNWAHNKTRHCLLSAVNNYETIVTPVRRSSTLAVHLQYVSGSTHPTFAVDKSRALRSFRSIGTPGEISPVTQWKQNRQQPS